MILLDTHAAIWLAKGHRRARPLARHPRLYLSPASLLEVQFLQEIGRVRLTEGRSAAALADDTRWLLDDPSAATWFEHACGVSWTHDPFDRLLVAHARMRGWKLATADDLILAQLDRSAVLAL